MIIPFIIFSLDHFIAFLFNSFYFNKVIALNGTYAHIGTTSSLIALISFIWKPIAGSLSDQIKPAKILALCILGNFVSIILTFFSTSLIYVIPFKVLSAFASPTQILVRTILSNSGKNQSKIIPNLGIITALTCICASLIFGELSVLNDGETYVFGLMLMSACCSYILSLNIKTPKVSGKNEETLSSISPIKSIKNLKKLFSSNTYHNIFLLRVLHSLSSNIIDSSLSAIFRERGIMGKNIGYLVSFAFIIMLITNILHGRIQKFLYSFNSWYLRIIHFSLINVFAVLAQGFTSSTATYVFFVNITIVCRCFIENSLMELLLIKVTSKDKAAIMGSYDSIHSLSELFSPLFSGLMIVFTGLPTIFFISAMLITFECFVAHKGHRKLKFEKLQ